MKPNKSITCVIPVYNEEGNIGQFIPELCQLMQQQGHPYDLLLIDDGSSDHTLDVIRQLRDAYPISCLRFSRNFGKEKALSAGLEYARGDAVILLDADFQHPVDVIPDFIRHWDEGYDMVYAVRQGREDEHWLKRVCARAFYRLTSRINRVNIPANAGDFRLLDRKIVDALQLLPERNRFMKGLYSWVGFKQKAVPFTVHNRRSGRSHWNFYALLDLAITGITSFTAFPLRMIALGGMFTAGLAFIYTLWIILSTLMFGIQTPGWATIVTIITFFGGLQLFAIGVVGEYIGRIFDEVKQRPHYIIDEEHSFEHLS